VHFSQPDLPFTVGAHGLLQHVLVDTLDIVSGGDLADEMVFEVLRRTIARCLADLCKHQPVGVGEPYLLHFGIGLEDLLAEQFENIQAVVEDAVQGCRSQLPCHGIAPFTELCFQVVGAGMQQVGRKNAQHEHAGDERYEQYLLSDLVHGLPLALSRVRGDCAGSVDNSNTLSAKPPSAGKAWAGRPQSG